MKRVNYCQAWYDGNGMISYNTRIVNIETKFDNTLLYKVTLVNYRSMTTLSHIRKYIELLEKQGNYGLAWIVQKLYDVAKKHKTANRVIWEWDGRIRVE